MKLTVPKCEYVVRDLLAAANRGAPPERITLTYVTPRPAPRPAPKPVATPAPKAPPRPQRPKPNRALERGQARAAAALLLELQGPDLERRKAECATWHRLRCNGWRPLPDCTWRGPQGQLLDPNRRTHR